jgi:hypothetical protein
MVIDKTCIEQRPLNCHFVRRTSHCWYHGVAKAAAVVAVAVAAIVARIEDQVTGKVATLSFIHRIGPRESNKEGRNDYEDRISKGIVGFRNFETHGPSVRPRSCGRDAAGEQRKRSHQTL